MGSEGSRRGVVEVDDGHAEEAGAGAVVLHSLFEEQITIEDDAIDHVLLQGANGSAEAMSYFPDMEAWGGTYRAYLDHVKRAKKALSIPVIGMGGISTAADVAEFMLAGATAVQIGTASYWDPCATEKIVDELQRWCADRNITRLAELTGGMILE